MVLSGLLKPDSRHADAGFLIFYGCFVRRATIRDQKARINWRIRVPQVRLIDDQGEQVGIIPTAQALQMAEERGLDLVEVAPNAEPPVCRLMDYGKFLYEQAKKEREARKNQKVVEVKEIRLQPNSDDHYVSVKTNQARKFLEDGDKVKFTVRFRGRQLAHTEIGVDMLKDLAESLRDVSVTEQLPQMVGRSQSLVLAPSPKSLKRAADRSSQSNTPRPSPPAGPDAGEGNNA